MVTVLYKLFLAVMISLFIGFGISVFYPAPKAPEYPSALEKTGPSDLTEDQKKEEREFAQRMDDYQKKFQDYNKNVSVIIIALSVLLLVISLSMLLSVDIFGDGVLLAGVFTLLYGMIRGIMSNNNQFQFIVVTIGLVLALVLGYYKFIRSDKKTAKSS